jgi:hypothetical protein
MGLFNRTPTTDDDEDSDYDSDGKFVPGPGFYNVTPVAEPVYLLSSDDDDSYFQKDDGSLIKTQNVDNEGDD